MRPRGRASHMRLAYRSVRRRTTPQVPSSTWMLLNSPFALLMTSTLIVSGSGFIWSQYSARWEINSARAENISQLRSEIEFRLVFLAPIKKPLFTYPEMYTATAALIGADGNNDMNGHHIGTFSPIHQRFEKRGLASLLWELSSELAKGGRPNSISGTIVSSATLTANLDNQVVLVSPVRPGVSSTWRFSSPAVREQTIKEIDRINRAITAQSS
jgi:hypothetical protein